MTSKPKKHGIYIHTYIYTYTYIHIYIYESLNESFFLLTGKIYVLHLYIYIMYVALFEIIGGIIFFEYCIAVLFSSVNKKENKKKKDTRKKRQIIRERKSYDDRMISFILLDLPWPSGRTIFGLCLPEVRRSPTVFGPTDWHSCNEDIFQPF